MYALLSNMVWVCYSETWSELRKQQWYYSSGLKNISYCLYSPAIPLLLWKILKFETFYSPKYCSPWETFLGQLKLIFILAVYCSILYMSDRSNWFVELFKSPILFCFFFFLSTCCIKYWDWDIKISSKDCQCFWFCLCF